MSEIVKNIRPIVFYDGACPLCKKEIKHYIRIDQDNNIDWIDVSTDTVLLKQYNITYTDAMKKLHVIELNGKTKIGIDAFLTIWKFLPYYKNVAKVVTFFHMQKPMAWIYDVFAKQRYKKYLQRQACTTSCK